MMATATENKTRTKQGTIVQIVGVVIDVEFDNHLPAIYNGLTMEHDGELLTLEVAQHLSQNTVRAVSLGTTDGLKRGDKVEDSGRPISVPVGDTTLGRMFNVTGQAIDGKDNVKNPTLGPIHRNPPALVEQSGKVEIFETGIKVIDLICPIPKGGKVGLFGGAGVGKTVFIQDRKSLGK
jgi:F-type H+-transporting ATPase subunit beta